jgi:hypothetical protein
MEKSLETLQSAYITGLKEQIEVMKKLNKLNDDIIKAKDEHIIELERVIEELHGLARRSIDLAEKQL